MLQLGRFVAMFGTLEWLLHHITAMLIAREHSIGGVVTQELLDRPLCELIVRLAKDTQAGPPHLSDDDRVSIKKLADDVVTLLPERNRVVHGFWASESPDMTNLEGRNIRKWIQTMRGGATDDRGFSEEALRDLTARTTDLLREAAAITNHLSEMWDAPNP